MASMAVHETKGVVRMTDDKGKQIEFIVKRDPFGNTFSQEILVRCMNCKYRAATDSPYWDYFCRRHNRNTDENDYCSDGEPC